MLKVPGPHTPWAGLTTRMASWPGWPQPADPAKQEPRLLIASQE